MRDERPVLSGADEEVPDNREPDNGNRALGESADAATETFVETAAGTACVRAASAGTDWAAVGATAASAPPRPASRAAPRCVCSSACSLSSARISYDPSV